MSYSLVRKSLELLEYETDINTDKKKKKKRKQHGAIDLIPAHQRILKTSQNSKVISQLNRSSNKQKLSQKVEEAVQDNVSRLLLLSNQKVDEKTTEKLLHRAVKKQSGKSQEDKKEGDSPSLAEEFSKFAAKHVDW